MHVRTLGILIDDLRGDIGEALGFPARPKGDFIGNGELGFIRTDQLWRRILRVDGGESGGVSCQDGGTPFFERGEGSTGGHLVRQSNGSEEKSERKCS